MIKAERFKGLEEKIGYSFTNKRLLALAMTHSSYANEQRGRRKANNERLEFLGDAVLEVTISDYVFREYPSYNEGRLTKLRSSLVCEYTLAICARDVELGKYILLSRGEDATGGRERDSILSDAFEALIGAIYIDGGMDKARFFIHNHLLKDVEDKSLFYDAKRFCRKWYRRDRILAYSMCLQEKQGQIMPRSLLLRLELVARHMQSEKEKRKKEQNRLPLIRPYYC